MNGRRRTNKIDDRDREEKESKGRTDEPRRKAGVAEVKVN